MKLAILLPSSIVFALSLQLAGCRTPKWKNGVIASRQNTEAPKDAKEDSDIYGDDFYGEDELVIRDPLERINRLSFALNSFLLKNVLDPIINIYKSITNEFLRGLVSNLGNRIGDPMIFLNSLLQLDHNNAGNTLAVFGINMTVGFFGLFDPAKTLFGLERENKNLGQTLAFYGVDEGFYLVLPFFGPSTLRDGIGLASSFYVDPLSYNCFSLGRSRGKSLTPNYLIVPKYFAQYIDMMDGAVTLNIIFLQGSLDPYVFARYGYMNSRGRVVSGTKK
ncbi:MAG: VacJ family lipoprotein [Rickettsiales bacterium]|jgi:phospholipid-binding lipoprotein MlaA|nr:VacJ family lipoprotein [Rickettsiales bacterium]